MTKPTLKISNDLALPLSTVTSTLIVYGGKGMGKTNFGSVLMEEMSRAGLRWSVIDPMGVWWGLRHNRDGKGLGVECLILGGPHGDIPIEPTGGAVVADLVVDETVNVIIDISRKSNGEAWGVGEKIRFATDYGKRLLQRQAGLLDGHRREPLFQMIDEAARFIPQMVRSGESDVAKCVSVWAQITEEGRNFGLGVGLLTQRSARLNKDVAELADAMIAFRTIGPNSVGAVMDWLGEHIEKSRAKELVASLRSVARGTALVVSPGWLQYEGVVAMRERETFDSSATPKPGEHQKKVTGRAAKPDLDKYTARMVETIERAKADDPRELRKQIETLKREVGKGRGAATAATVPATRSIVDSAAIDRAVKIAIQKRDREHAEQMRTLTTSYNRLHSGVIEIAKKVSILAGIEPPVIKPPQFTPPETSHPPMDVNSTRPARNRRETMRVSDIERTTTRVFNRAEVNPSNGDEPRLRPGARRMLAACVQWYPKEISESQVAALAGVKRSSGSFSSYKSNLVVGGYITLRNGLWSATDKGIEFASASLPPAPSSTAEVLAIWKPKLRPGARRMLDVLIGEDREMSQEELAAAAGVSAGSGSFSSYLSNLVTADLAVKPDRGTVAANREALFL